MTRGAVAWAPLHGPCCTGHVVSRFARTPFHFIPLGVRANVSGYRLSTPSPRNVSFSYHPSAQLGPAGKCQPPRPLSRLFQRPGRGSPHLVALMVIDLLRPLCPRRGSRAPQLLLVSRSRGIFGCSLRR